MIGALGNTFGALFAAYSEAAKARGIEQTASSIRGQVIAYNIVSNPAFCAPIDPRAPGVTIRYGKRCAYCAMDDFAHNQCQRCGAPEGRR